MNLRPGQKMDAQSCRYCHGTGSIMMTHAFVRGYRQRVGRRCTHIVGNSVGENGSAQA